MSEAPSITVESLGLLSIEWEIGGIADPVGQIADYIISSVETALSGAFSAITSTINNVVNAAIGGVSSAINNITGGLNSVIAAVQGLPSQITNSLSNITSTISSILSSSINTIASSVSQLGGSISSSLNSVLSQLDSGLYSLSATISNSINSILSKLSSTLGSLVSQISGAVSTAMASLSSSLTGAFSSISSGLASVGAIITGSLNTAFGTMSTLITGAFSGLASTLNNALKGVLGVDWSSVITNIEKFATFILAFGANPIVVIQSALNFVLQSFGLPTLDQIRTELETQVESIVSKFAPQLSPILDGLQKIENFTTTFPQTFVNTITSPDIQKALVDAATQGVQNAFIIPSAITSLFNSLTTVLNKLTEQHSPSILDDLGTILEVLAAGGGLGALFQSEAWKAIISGKPFPTTLTTDAQSATNLFKPLTDYLAGIGGQIIPLLTGFASSVDQALIDLGNYVVDGIVTVAGITEVNPPKDDPFGRISNIALNEFRDLADYTTSLDAKGNLDITKGFEAVLTGIATGVAVGETAEYLGLTIDLVHPFKNTQFRKKFENIIRKLGLGHITQLAGAALVAVSLRPVVERFFNKISQIQLLGDEALLLMNDFALLDDPTTDEFLQEKGYNKTFRGGLKELHFQIPSLDGFRNAYLRYVADGTMTRATFENEYKQYLKIQRIKPDARALGTFKFSLSDQDLANKVLYAIPSFRELRLMSQVGNLDPKLATQIYTSNGMSPDFIAPLANAINLFSSQAERAAIKTAASKLYTKGYTLVATFTNTLTKALFGTNPISYLQQASDLEKNVALTDERIKDADEDYIQGFTDKPTYVPLVTKYILDTDLLTAHIALADNARARYDRNLVRTGANAVVLQIYADLSQGANTEDEFRTIAGKFGKTQSEEDALVEAAALSLTSKIRTANFRTLQTQLAKLYITPDVFVTQCEALDVDEDLIKAAKARILSALLPKPKVTQAQVATWLTPAKAVLTTQGGSLGSS